MKVVKKNEAQKFNYAKTSQVLEYSIKLAKKEMDFCINTINGRYPEQGFCSNTKCDEICYVLEGKGQFVSKDERVDLAKGDIIYIDKNDIYFWNGNFKLAMICSPAWTKEQCKLYDEK